MKRSGIGNARHGLAAANCREAVRAFSPRLERSQIGEARWTGRLVTLLPEQRRQLKDGYILHNVGFEYNHATRTQTLLLKKIKDTRRR